MRPMSFDRDSGFMKAFLTCKEPGKGMKRTTAGFMLFSLMLAIAVSMPVPGSAAERITKYDPPEEMQKTRRMLVVPFPYYNESIGPGIGAAAIAQGYVQPQMLTVGSAMASGEGTHVFFLMVRNGRAPFMERLILEPQICQNTFKSVRSYVLNNPAYPNERSASNDSDEDNYLEADGTDFWFECKLRFLLPLGDGESGLAPRVKLDRGVPIARDDASRVWNPMASGRTYIELNPFYRNRDTQDELDQDLTQKTAGLDFALTYDNTDYWPNPSEGSYQSLFISRDWGGLGSSAPWTVIGADIHKYLSLGESRYARQRVLAFDLWTVNCLTWDSFDVKGGGNVYHRPPSYKGGNLGGLWKLRGYPATRFNDQAAIYYAMEYRYTLAWNPLKDFTLNNRLEVDWFQLVGFGELGRVAPDWDAATLHRDMKWSIGAGARTMVNGIIVRADLGVSAEGSLVQLFIGQPF
jgi:hypothetical protein